MCDVGAKWGWFRCNVYIVVLDVFLPCCHSYGLVPDCETLSFVATASNGCVLNIREVRGGRHFVSYLYMQILLNVVFSLILTVEILTLGTICSTLHNIALSCSCLIHMYISNEVVMLLVANICSSG